MPRFFLGISFFKQGLIALLFSFCKSSYQFTPVRFKWVGYIDKNNQEANTGDKSVDKAFHFLVAQNLSHISICLKDCDTNRQVKRVP